MISDDIFQHRLLDRCLPKDLQALQEARKFADDILMRHYPNLPLGEIKNDALWLGLFLTKHPRYTEFISQCPGFDAVKVDFTIRLTVKRYNY
jgi:hypothetical protein